MIKGAATAFGLTSLLPLNVPANKPLMYCSNNEFKQTHIQLDGNIYSCVNSSIAISCPRQIGFKTIDKCANKTMQCDLKGSNEVPATDLSCSDGTLISTSDIACNSTVFRYIMKLNQTRTVVQCFPGAYPKALVAFIPTTSTESTISKTTEKQLSIDTKIYNFFLNLFGISKDETTSNEEISPDDHRDGLGEGESHWIPEALTLPPDFEVPEQEYPFSLEYQLTRKVKGRTIVVKQHPVDESVEKVWLKLHLEHGVTLPPFVAKIPKRKHFYKIDDQESDENSDEMYDSQEDFSTPSAPSTPLIEELRTEENIFLDGNSK